MISRRFILNLAAFRSLSIDSLKGSKRFLQTIPIASKNDLSSSANLLTYNDSPVTSKWSKHTLSFPVPPVETKATTPVRRSRASRFPKPEITPPIATAPVAPVTPVVAPKPKRTLRPRKALITLTDKAMAHLRGLMNQPDPKLIRIGVSNRGCSGLTYNLEYVDKPGKFDELIEQGDVKVLIDSKALFSIVGSEMDWLDDKLSSRFIFRNPNSKGTCGCGESFMV